jgi:hypothetical protein
MDAHGYVLLAPLRAVGGAGLPPAGADGGQWREKAT